MWRVLLSVALVLIIAVSIFAFTLFDQLVISAHPQEDDGVIPPVMPSIF
jgi:hypothetical protein